MDAIGNFSGAVTTGAGGGRCFFCDFAKPIACGGCAGISAYACVWYQADSAADATGGGGIVFACGADCWLTVRAWSVYAGGYDCNGARAPAVCARDDFCGN